MLVLPSPPNVPGMMLGTSPYGLGDLSWQRGPSTNLLTANQASVENGNTTGFTRFYSGGGPAQISATKDQAAHGLWSLAVPVATFASTSVDVGIGSNADYVSPVATENLAPVLPGRVYTATASVRGDIACGARLTMVFWKVDGTTASGTAAVSSATIQTSNSAWQTLSVSLLSPTDAAYAMVYVRFSDTTAGTQYIDKMGLWDGHGGVWAMPGEPIPNLGVRWDESVGRRAFVWDTVNNREQMIYGDTGLRAVTSGFDNGWSGTLYIRRINHKVSIYLNSMTISATNGSFYTVPSGFQSYSVNGIGATRNTSSGLVSGFIAAGTCAYYGTLTAGQAILGSATFETNDAWPTSLPGAAQGPIPNA